MPKTMKERAEQARSQQKEIADARPNKRYKTALALKHIANHREGLLMEQLGLCAICETPVMIASKRYHLDHDHDTGEIRGVLCHGCNVGLGMFKEDPVKMLRAIDYLNKFRLEKFEYNGKEEIVEAKPVQPVIVDTMTDEEFEKLPGIEKIAHLKKMEELRKNANNWRTNLVDITIKQVSPTET